MKAESSKSKSSKDNEFIEFCGSTCSSSLL
jgi:hypothetical protein